MLWLAGPAFIIYMKKQFRLKKLLFELHKILGLTTGAIVFIVSVTGALWVFNEEIGSLLDEEYEIDAGNSQLLTPSEARESGKNVFPDRHIHGTLYTAPDSPVEVIFYEAEPEFYQSVYLHPSSGEVLGVKNHLAGFFAFVLDGHIRLWMPDKIGSNIVAFSVLIFMLILLSGLILWWPKKNNRKQRFRFLWSSKTKWRRKNFDLHAITGFYLYLLAFILAFTGSIMAYDWFYYIVFKSAGGEKAPQFIVPQNVNGADALQDPSATPMDRLIVELMKERPDAESYEIHYPYTDSSSIYVEISNTEGVYYNSDYRFFDQYTLEEIPTPSIYGHYEDADFADKVIRMNYDIHIGAIGGIPGKLIAFFISITIATLPVTGFLMWLGRNNKRT